MALEQDLSFKIVPELSLDSMSKEINDALSLVKKLEAENKKLWQEAEKLAKSFENTYAPSLRKQKTQLKAIHKVIGDNNKELAKTSAHYKGLVTSYKHISAELGNQASLMANLSGKSKLVATYEEQRARNIEAVNKALSSITKATEVNRKNTYTDAEQQKIIVDRLKAQVHERKRARIEANKLAQVDTKGFKLLHKQARTIAFNNKQERFALRQKEREQARINSLRIRERLEANKLAKVDTKGFKLLQKKAEDLQWQLRLEEKLAKAKEKNNASGVSSTTTAVRKQTKALKSATKAVEAHQSSWHRHLTYMESTGVVLKYGLISNALYGIAGKIGDVVKELIAYDSAIYNNSAVLGISTEQAKTLADNTRELAKTYGGSIEDLDKVTLTLGRAGVEYENLAAATKAVSQMATITGDSLTRSSEVVSTFITNFKDAGITVEQLANKLAFVANATKQTTEDLGTFANYGLQTAKSLGLTVDTTLALEATLSRLGYSASTVGTEIQKLDKVFNTSTTSMNRFFDLMFDGKGKAAKKSFVEALANKDEDALLRFSDVITNVPYDTFLKATDGMEIRTKKMLLALRMGNKLFHKYSEEIKNAADVSEQAKAKALGLATILERVNAEFVTIFNKFEGRTLNAIFPSRDKITETRNELQYLVQGTDEYNAKMRELTRLNADVQDSLDNFSDTMTNVGLGVLGAVGSWTAWKIAVKSLKPLITDVVVVTEGALASLTALGYSTAASFGIIGGLLAATTFTGNKLYDVWQQLDSISDSTTKKELLEKHLNDWKNYYSNATRIQAEYNKISASLNDKDAHNTEESIKRKRQALELLRKEWKKNQDVFNLGTSVTGLSKNHDKLLSPKEVQEKEYALKLEKELATRKELTAANLVKAKKQNRKLELAYYDSQIKALKAGKEFIAQEEYQHKLALQKIQIAQLEQELMKDSKQAKDAQYKIDRMKQTEEIRHLKATRTIRTTLDREEERTFKYKRKMILAEAQKAGAGKTKVEQEQLLLDAYKKIEKLLPIITDNQLRLKNSRKVDVDTVKTEADYNQALYTQNEILEKLVSKYKTLQELKRQPGQTNVPVYKQAEAGVHEKQRDLANALESNNPIRIQQAKIKLLEAEYALRDAINKRQLELMQLEANQDSKNLAAQQRLIETSITWSGALNGVHQNIAELSTSIQGLIDPYFKFNKARQALDAKYKKDYAEAIGDNEKQKLLLKQYTEDKINLTKQERAEEIAAYSDIAGAMSSFYKEGTAGAAAFQAVQATLGIINGITAIQGAWASGPFPANLPAVAATTAAVLPMIDQLISLGGSGSAAGTAMPSRVDTYKQKSEDYADSMKPITDRLDRQIELLQAISGYGGSAIAKQLEDALTTYRIDSMTNTIKNLGTVGNQFWTPVPRTDGISGSYNTISAGYKIGSLDDYFGSPYEDNIAAGYDKELTRIRTLYGDYVNAKAVTSTSGGLFDYDNTVSKDWYATLNDDYLKQDNNLVQFILKLKENNDLGRFGVTDSEYKTIIEDAKSTSHDFAMSIINSYQTVIDAGKDFKEQYDAIYGPIYKSKRLTDAFKDVTELMNPKGTSILARGLYSNNTTTKSYKDFKSFLDDTIKSIDAMNLTREEVALLNSDNEKDLSKKIELETRLSQEFGEGAKQALNFKDSIELVAQALADSRNNIEDWLESFRTRSQSLINMAMNLDPNMKIATAGNELTRLFERLSGGVEGLSNQEKDFLDANRAYIQDLQQAQFDVLNTALTDLSAVIDKLRGASTTSTQSLSKFKHSMQITQEYLNNKNYEAYNDSLKKTIELSSILTNSDPFSTGNQQKYEQLLAANQFEGMQKAIKPEIDLLTQIRDNTKVTADDRYAILQYNSLLGLDGTQSTIDYYRGNTVDTILNSVGQFAVGGFTGRVDSTGQRVAGVVHENEWVAPRWMIEDQPDLFNSLESLRQQRKFAAGGFTSKAPTSTLSNNELLEEIKELNKEVKDLKQLQITQTANSTRSLNTQRAILSEVISEED